MKKAPKILLGFTVIAALGAGAIYWQLDSLVQTFKPQIEQQLTRDLGAPTTIGKLKASIFPQPGFEISELVIKGTTDTSLRSASIYADLKSLLQKKIVFSNITIDGARLTVVKSKDGRLSLAGIKQKPAPTTPADKDPLSSTTTNGNKSEDGPAPAPTPAAEKKQLELEFRAISIKDSTLTIRDDAATPPQTITVGDINGSLRDIDPKGSAKGDLRATVRGAASADITLRGVFGNPIAGYPLDVKLQIHKVELEPLVSLLRAYGVKTDGLQLQKAVYLSGSLRAVPGGLEYQGEFEGSDAAIEVSNYFSKPAGKKFIIDTKLVVGVTKAMTAEEFNVKLGSSTLELPFSVAPNGAVSAKLKTSTISLSELSTFVPTLASYKLAGDMSAQVETTVSKLENGTLDIKPNGSIDLRRVSASYATNAQDQNAGAVGVEKLSGSIALTPDIVKFEKLSGELAGQPLTIEGKITNLDAPAIALTIASPEIQAAPLLKALQSENAALKDSFLKNVNITVGYRTAEKDGSIKLTANEALLTDVTMNNLALSSSITPQRITLERSTLSLFGGSATIDGGLTRRDTPRFETAIHATNMDAAKLSEVALKDSSLKVRGTMSSLGVTLTGATGNPKSTMAGNVRASLEKGAITGVNILGQTLGKLTNIPGIGNALSSYIPPQYQALLQTEETPFDTLQINADLGEGRVNYTPVDLKHSAYEVSGTGWTSFAGEMEIHGKLKITEKMASSMTLKEPKLKLLLDPDGGLVVPILISKRDGRTIVIPDIEDLLKRAARNTAKEAVSRELDKVAPGLGGAAKALDSLFK